MNATNAAKASGEFFDGLPCSTLSSPIVVDTRAINARNSGYVGLKLAEANCL